MKVAALFCICVLIGSCDVASTFVPLRVEYPRVIIEYVGRSAPSYLTMNAFTARSELRVPEGSKNLAFHKPVKASDAAPILGDCSLVTDGDKSGIDTCLTLNSGPQWIQIDLQRSGRIYGLAGWHDYGCERVITGMVVELSNDPNFEKGVVTVTPDPFS